MTRKDYERFAAIIRNAIKTSGNFDPAAMDTIRAIAQDMEHVFVMDNPRFDRDRFMKACGFGQ